MSGEALAAAIQAYRRNREAYDRGPRTELVVLAEFASAIYDLFATGRYDGLDQRWWIANVDGMGTGGHFYEARLLAERLGISYGEGTQ